MNRLLTSWLLIFLDILFMNLVFYALNYYGFNDSNLQNFSFQANEFKSFSFIVLIILVLFYYEKIYTLRYDFWQETYKIFKSIFLAYLVVLALFTLEVGLLDYSQLFITSFFTLAMFVIPISKRLVKRILFQFSFFRVKTNVVGSKEQMEVLLHEFQKNWYLGMEGSTLRYDTVIISSKDLSVEAVNEKLDKYLNDNHSVYVVPYVTNLNFATASIMEYSNIRLNTIRVENKLLLKKNTFIKNIFDILLALMSLPVFLVLHVIISLLIKMDSKGSVFFRQKRIGKGGDVFQCYKYRTMFENSNELLEQYLEENPGEKDYYGLYHKYQNDPRITKVGKFLRATSLDELPQIINILKGDMSFIGPRPYMIEESDKLGPQKQFILKVKPGITGLWQVSGRNELTFEQRNKLEVWYIKNWSLWADFVILVKTIKVVLLKIGAK